MARQIARGQNRQEKRANRAKVGSLRDANFPPRLRKRYGIAVERFFIWMSRMGYTLDLNFLEFDDRLVEFIETLWQCGDPKSFAADLLSGVGRFERSLRKHMPLAWSMLDTWSKLELPVRATPLCPTTANAIAGVAFSELRNFRFGIAVVVGFCAFLRTVEIIHVQKKHITFSGDRRLIIDLGLTKGGKRKGETEQVTLTDGVAISLIKWLISSMQPGDYLFPFSYNTFSRLLGQSLQVLQLSHDGYRPHSLRRGGATWDFRQHGNISVTSERGRWSNLRTCRIYINEAAVALSSLQRSDLAKSLVARYANTFADFVA
jgi:integrase